MIVNLLNAMRLVFCVSFCLLLGLSACQQQKGQSSSSQRPESSQPPTSATPGIGPVDVAQSNFYFSGVFDPSKPSEFFDCATQKSVSLNSSEAASKLLEQAGKAQVYAKVRAFLAPDGKMTISYLNNVATDVSTCADSLLLIGLYNGEIAQSNPTIRISLRLESDHTFKATATEGNSPVAVVSGIWNQLSPTELSLVTTSPKRWLASEMNIHAGKGILSWWYEGAKISIQRQR